MECEVDVSTRFDDIEMLDEIEVTESGIKDNKFKYNIIMCKCMHHKNRNI